MVVELLGCRCLATIEDHDRSKAMEKVKEAIQKLVDAVRNAFGGKKA
jgi:hypothetical protein